MTNHSLLCHRSDERLATLIAKNWLQKEDQVLSVLDIGCGDGVVQQNLPNNCRYIGLDLSDACIYSQNKNNSNIRYVGPSELVKLLHSLEKVDAVLLFDVLEHTAEFTALFEDALSLSNRYIVVSLPNELFLADRLRMLMGEEVGANSLDLVGMPIGFKHQYIVNIAKARKLLVQKATEKGFHLKQEIFRPLQAKAPILQPLLWLMRKFSSTQLWSMGSVFIFEINS